MNKIHILVIVLVTLVGCTQNKFISAEALSQGSLAFVANPSGNWELFLLADGQTRPVQLTHTSLDERTPAISPDRSQIAYVTSDGSLWVMTVATKESQQLAGSPGRYGYPTWTADGKSLVYTVYSFTPPTEDADIYSYSLRDKKQTLLLQQTGPQDFPALSPSGEQLAYMSSLATLVPGFGATLTQQLWVVSLRDGKPRQIFWGSFRETKPSWSPDGKWLAFSSDRNGNTELWIVDSGGGQAPQQLSSGPGTKTSPTWSPAGDEIAFVSTQLGRSEVRIMNVSTKQSRNLLAGADQFEMRDPSWR